MSVIIRLKHSRYGVKKNGAGLSNRLNNMDIKNSGADIDFGEGI